MKLFVEISALIKYMNYRFHDSDRAFYKIPENRNQISELILMASISDNAEILSNLFDDQYSKTPLGIRFRYHDLYRIENLNKKINAYFDSHFNNIENLSAYTTGTAILISHTLVPLLTALNQSLLVAVVAIFLIMILLFRSIKFAILSMIPNLIPLAMTLGLMGLMDISLNYTTAPLAAIALGLAIDDTIHFLARFRMEFRKEKIYSKAIYNTIISVGKPILISSIVLTAGFCIFLFSNFQPTQNMGILISFTVISAVFADLILLPVLLFLFKPLGKESPANG